jgi:hypothetical protein
MEEGPNRVQNFRDLLMGEWFVCEISGLPDEDFYEILRQLKNTIPSKSVRDVSFIGQLMIMFNNDEVADPRGKAGFSLNVAVALEKLQEQYPKINIGVY